MIKSLSIRNIATFNNDGINIGTVVKFRHYESIGRLSR